MLKNFLRNGTVAFVTLLIVSLFCCFLLGTAVTDKRADAETSPFAGNGTADNPYKLSTPNDLLQLSQLVNDGAEDDSGKLFSTRYYQLTDNIDMTGKTWTPIGLGSQTQTYFEDITADVLAKYNLDTGKTIFNGIWAQLYTYLAIDTSGTPASAVYSDSQTYYYVYSIGNYFYGTLDGNGYTVRNLSYSTDIGTTDENANAYGGLFGYLCNASVFDLHIENPSLSMTGPKSIVGGIAGGMFRSTVSDCSVTATLSKEIYATKHAGGIVGQLNQETFSPLSAQYENETFSHDGFSFFLQSEERDGISSNLVTRCTAIGDNLTVSSGESNSTSGYAGGIVGYSKDETSPQITNCFNSAHVSHKGIVKQAAGILGGASKTVSLSCCVGVKSYSQEDTLYYGAIIPVPQNSYIFTNACFFDKDISSDTYCIGKTTYELLSAGFVVSQLSLSTTWSVPTASGSTYYYPLPASNSDVKSSFSAQKITVDGEIKDLHQTGIPFTYTFESAPKKKGYTFSKWNDGTNQYDAGAEQEYTLSADLAIHAEWTLNAPSLTLQKKYSFAYNGTDQSITIRFDHALSDLTASYQWFLWNGEEYDDLSSSLSALSVKNVSQSGKYKVTVTLDDGNGLTSSASAETTVTVTKKQIECTVSVEKNSKIYDGDYPANGKNLTLPTYTVSTLCSSHTETVSFRYATQKYTTQEEMNNGTFINVENIIDVGTYYIYPAVQIKDDNGTNVTDNYSITQKNTNLTYSVTNASVTVDEWTEAVFDYDNSTHTIDESDFVDKVHTVQNTTFDIKFGYGQDSCFLSEINFTDAQEMTIYYLITAQNHNACSGSLHVTVRRISVTLQAKENDAKPTKTYDQTDYFTPYFFTSAFYDAVYPVGYTGPETTITPVSATYSQTDAGEDIDVTVTFSLADSDNYCFSGNNYLVYSNGVIRKAVVSPVFLQDYFYSKTYDGTTSVTTEEIPSSCYCAQGSFGTVPVTLTSACLDSANAGERTCSYTFRLNDDANYAFANGTNETETELSASVLPSPVTVTPLSVIQKDYDKTRYATPDLLTSDDYELTFQSGLTAKITVSSVQFAKVWVGDTTATVTFACDSDNFSVPSCTFSAHINPAKVTLNVGTATPIDRPYDGTNIVYFQGERFTGVIDGDTLSITSANILSADASETAYEIQNETITLGNANYVFETIPTEIFNVFITPKASTVHPSYGNATVYLSDTTLPELFLAEGDTPGTVEWDDPSILVEGKQDFSWTFTPESHNYLACSGQICIDIIHVRYIRIWVSRLPTKVNYKPFEVFSPVGMEISAEKNILTDGTPKTDPSQTGAVDTVSWEECSISYENGTSCFLFGDSKITVYFDELSCEQSINVSQITLPAVSVSGLNEYNGSSQEVTLLYYNETLMTCSGNSGIHAGSYTATVSLKDEVNYSWENGSSDPLLLPWTIYPKGQGKITLDSYEFTYSGQPVSVHFLTDPTELASCHLVESGSTLSATSAGTYTITIELADGDYYWLSQDQYDTSDVAPQIITWRIVPLKINKPVLHNQPYTYNGEWQTIETDNETYYYGISGDTTVKQVGSYSVTASLKNSNYAWADGTTDNVILAFSVQPLVITEPELTSTSYTYSGNRFAVIVPSDPYYTATGTLSQTKVGTYSYTVTLVDPVNTKWANTKTSSITKTWSITPLKVKMPALSGSNVYTGYEQSAVIAFSSFYTLSGNKQTAVGDYIATATLNDKTNYTWENGTTNDISVSWSIQKCIINRPSAPSNLLYNGLKQTAFIESNSAYSVTGNSAKNVGDYTAVVAFNDEENYLWDDGTHSPLSFQWSICSLTFISNGEKSISTTYALGSSLSTPVRSGYNFKGWYTTSDYQESSLITSLDSVDGNITIYAKWEKDPNAITTENTGTTSSEQETGLSTGLIIGICVFAGCLLIAAAIFVLGKTGLMGKKH